MARSPFEPTRHASVPIELIGPAQWPARRGRRRVRRLMRVIAPAAGTVALVALVAQLLPLR